MAPLRSLTVVYDPACGLCTSVKDWIQRQVPLDALEFVPLDSAETRRRFPSLPPGELAVIGDSGEAWLGNQAWIVCLWAVRDYRDWALRLASPLLLPLAREAFAAVSRNRSSLSALLGLHSDREIEQQLRQVVVPKCEPAPATTS